MKKYFYLLIVTLIIIFPVKTYALSLSCIDGEYEYGDEFKCSLTGEANVTYKELSATIESNDYLSCTIAGYADGFQTNMENVRTSGTPTGEGTISYVDFKCKVKTKTTEDLVNTEFVLKNVKYTDASDYTSDPEILRSNPIKVKKYVDTSQITTTDGKPRDTSNGNSLLKKLSDENLDKYFTFSKFITQYKFDVLFEVDEINFQYEPNVEGADVRIEGNTKLEVGTNVIDVYVTSPDLTSQTCYTLEINRLPRGEAIYYPEKDATLKKLTIRNYPINFESIIKQYTIKVDSVVNQLDIEPIVNVKDATFVIEGNEDLKNKSTITITVTSKDKTTKETYSILVIKEREEKDYSSYIYLGIIVTILLIVIVFIVKSSNKRNSEVEKDMAKFTKLFGKKKKEQLTTVQQPVTQVTPVQPVQPQVAQPVNPVQQPVQAQPVQQVVPQQSVPVAPVQPVAPTQPVQPTQQVVPPVQQNPNNQN